MKKVKSILALGLLMVLLNSCVYSLFPIYTDDTLVYFPELLGRWELQGDSDEYIEFNKLTEENGFLKKSSEEEEQSLEKGYQIIIMEGDDKQVFVGHIAEIGNDFFLDLYPDERNYDVSIYSNMMPVHTFIKLRYSDDQLDLTAFDLEKLNKLFGSNLIRLRHENVDGTILITAQPTEIQKFLDRYSDDESVFEDTETYNRAS